jgi:hypothetical protein
MNGRISNNSDKVLWVVETDTGPAVAHKLLPGFASPPATDADGFRAVDGTLVNGHASWVKVTDLSSANVTSMPDGSLDRGCIFPFCRDVNDEEFGPVTFDEAAWGAPL